MNLEGRLFFRLQSRTGDSSGDIIMSKDLKAEYVGQVKELMS